MNEKFLHCIFNHQPSSPLNRATHTMAGLMSLLIGIQQCVATKNCHFKASIQSIKKRYITIESKLFPLSVFNQQLKVISSQVELWHVCYFHTFQAEKKSPEIDRPKELIKQVDFQWLPKNREATQCVTETDKCGHKLVVSGWPLTTC